ncbi:unnamed protein product [Pipistrellus nathusii]|uniref:Uncharacterized protein n=1 Tax=Pipistrellus nathusii TaxID=59473 RepID=A0ABP0A210_PIPNA
MEGLRTYFLMPLTQELSIYTCPLPFSMTFQLCPAETGPLRASRFLKMGLNGGRPSPVSLTPSPPPPALDACFPATDTQVRCLCVASFSHLVSVFCLPLGKSPL